VPDADARRALLLILGVLERHSRALRTLLARAGGPDLEGVLAAFEGRERALGEAARQLRARAARETAGPDRRGGGAGRGGGADGAARQGVLPLLEPPGATDADAAAGVIPRAVEDRSERLGTNGAVGARRDRDERQRMRQGRGRRPSRGVTQAVRLHQKGRM
jgi:hypothetical protein